MKRSMTSGDWHLPFHSESYMEAFIMAVKIVRPDEINLNGDILDLPDFKKWKRSHHERRFNMTFKEQAEMAKTYIERIRNCAPNADIRYLEGNHEDRYNRYVFDEAELIFDHVESIEELLGLKEMDIKWVPYNKDQLEQVLDSDLYVKHSPYSYSINCANDNIAKKHLNLLFNCTHRAQHTALRDGLRNVIRAYSNGCGIDFSSPAFSYMKTDNWTHGFSITNVYGGEFMNNFVEFISGCCVIDGKLVDGGTLLD